MREGLSMIGKSLFSILALFVIAVPVQAEVPLRYQAQPFLVGAPFNVLAGIAVDANGKLYVGDKGSSTIFKVDIASKAVSALVQNSPIKEPARMLIGDGRPLTGVDLIVSDENAEPTQSCCNGSVWRVDHQTGAYTLLALGNGGITPTGDPWGMALGPGGAFGDALYVMDFQGASPDAPFLFRIPSPGVTNLFPLLNPGVWTTDREPLEISFGGASFSGELFVLDPVATLGTPRNIWRIRSSGAISEFFRFPIQNPTAMKFGPGGIFGTNLYVLMDSGDLLEISADGTAVVVARGVPATLGGWTDIAFSPSGDRLFVVANNGIFEIVPLPPPIATPTLDNWALAALLVLLCVVALRSPRLQARR
jgi:hypothetical protein